MKTTCALLLAAAALAAHAQEDPLKSAACGAALADLQAARGGAAGPPGTLRDAAARACLGSAVVPTRPARVLQAPVAVPPPQIDVPPQPPTLRPLAPPPPPVVIQRPPVPAICDANGCWANDGTHLQQVPPSLLGPAGLCSQQGGVVYCP